MTSYAPSVREARFLLDHVTPLDRLRASEAFAGFDARLIEDVLDEAARFAAEVVAPTNRDGDREGCTLTDGQVRVPEAFHAAYAQYVAAGWGAIGLPARLGGGGFPLVVANVVKEWITAANMAFSLGPLLNTAAVHLLDRHATDEQCDRYARRLVSGEWAGTMNLTEPQAGSDVGAATARAVPTDDGSARLFGQKIFITFGEHDLTEQIIHLVLARLPDAPAGTRGLSLFIVPKFQVGGDGSIGERNDVRAIALEKKLGIHGSPTCVMAYGDGGQGAVGELIGPPNQGMAQMFTMMNDARLGVGIQGVAIAERACQQALAFARQRVQGRPPGAEASVHVPIVAHPDVRRMLMTQRAFIAAARALCSLNAWAMDLTEHGVDADERDEHRGLADLLTPLSKAWATDLGVELTSLAIQVHGGMGYIEETGVAQHWRDARIAPIYEGTNGIQAIDLVLRKLPADDGVHVARLVDRMRATAAELAGSHPELATPLAAAVAAAAAATATLRSREGDPESVLAAAAPYLRMLATTVGAWLLVGSAVAADRLLADGDEGRYGVPFLRGKIATARFFVTQLLPEVHALAAVVEADPTDLTGREVDGLED